VINSSIKPLATTLEDQAKENKKKDIKNIGLSYFLDKEQAWKDIADDFYAYFAKDHKDGERPDLLKNFIVDNKEIFSQDQEKIKAFLLKEGKKVGYMKFLKDVFSDTSNFQVFQTIRDSHLNDVSKYKRIQVLYDGKDIERASFGQKCTAVMVILLLFGNYPLVIDEPEAHLDSSLIANYLVPLIKRTKINRQIIFATHNANFVVNGDAEKIFILKNDTGSTEVVETTIENLENRDELLKLEGGREAFRKRGEKLHI
ncbi:MAG: AAA family ATPase, partial [Candidatus Wildermuthbacteria bacterium]|nr:AAA family ATPase [Candidatus Wildermuthbacteria bacterium]